MAPSFVTADDIIEFDLDGAPIDGQEKKLFFERVIHGEIYKARPDVMAVVHSHSASLIPFCNSDTRLRPMTNGAAFLGTGAPVFEIRDVDEDGDLNVCNPAQGKALAQTLGSVGLVLMRGHGAVVVGDSVRQVVRRAVIAERNALQQIQAAVLGPVHFLRDVEIAHANSGRSKDPDRAWSLWARKVGRDENSPQGKLGPRS
jgi:HCOMODA/2-hydroxy-3-carboxy-muconic semialdehyde decarboxylase